MQVEPELYKETMFSVVSKQKRQVFGIQLSGRGLAQLKALGLIRQYDKANEQKKIPVVIFLCLFLRLIIHILIV